MRVEIRAKNAGSSIADQPSTAYSRRTRGGRPPAEGKFKRHNGCEFLPADRGVGYQVAPGMAFIPTLTA